MNGIITRSTKCLATILHFNKKICEYMFNMNIYVTFNYIISCNMLKCKEKTVFSQLFNSLDIYVIIIYCNKKKRGKCYIPVAFVYPISSVVH